MIKHPNKILCVGAGCNIEPVIHFSQTKEFVFIDSQPRIKNENSYLETKFNKKDYVSDFVNNLLLTCLFNGFELKTTTVIDKKYYTKIIPKKCYYCYWFKRIPKNINPTMLIFTNKKTDQTLTYYISTNINFNINPSLKYDISTSNAIIVTENFPTLKLLEYFGTPKIFIGYSNINYQKYDDNVLKDNILYFLHYFSCNRQYFFTDFYFVDKNTGNINIYNDFNDFLFSKKLN